MSAASNYGELDVYAVKEPSGDLALLVINVNPAASLTEQFNLTGFQPGGPAQVWQYGETQDTAQRQSSSGASALANSSASLGLSGSNFSYTFPAYSMTVLDLTPAPTVVTAAAAAPSPVTGTATALSVLGGYNGGESNLTYTWATTGTPPAAVSFSANGSNAAKNTTATFTKAGSYSFTVTIADPNGISTASSTSVTVAQTFKAVAISPTSSSLSAGGSQQFSASALDQFGDGTCKSTGAYVVVERRRKPGCQRKQPNLYSALCFRDRDRRGGQPLDGWDGRRHVQRTSSMGFAGCRLVDHQRGLEVHGLRQRRCRPGRARHHRRHDSAGSFRRGRAST